MKSLKSRKEGSNSFAELFLKQFIFITQSYSRSIFMKLDKIDIEIVENLWVF